MKRPDFNLLVALDALLQEGSVQGAAERLNLTPPAMSHALGRLRVALSDPLLVRAGQRLVATPLADAIRDRVREVVEAGRSILQDRPQEDLRTINRTFTVRLNNTMACVFGSALVQHVQAEAPGIRIRFSGRDKEDLDPLRDGTVDLDIGVDADMGPEIHSQLLLTDDLVGVVRSGHPITEQPISTKSYSEANHVVASRRGLAHGPIDAVLRSSALLRRIPVIVPEALVAMMFAASSDHVATVPQSIANWGRDAFGLAVWRLPFLTEPINIYQSWHPRLDLDPAHRLLRRSMLVSVGFRMSAESG